MPREISDQSAVLEAVRRLDIVSELLEEQNGKQKYAGDLEVIVRGRDYANGKKVGPYARLLRYDAGEEIMREGDWGGNTFYFAVEGALDVYIEGHGGTGAAAARERIAQIEPGACFGEMAVLAGVERNATISVPANSEALVLEVTRPALRLLRKLPKFGQALDQTYRAHGLGRTLEEVRQASAADSFTRELREKLGASAKFVVYGKNHVLCQEGAPVDKIIFIKDGWVRRVRGVPFDPATTGLVLGTDAGVGVDFLGAGNCLGLEGVASEDGKSGSGAGETVAKWGYSAAIMARTEALEIPLAELAGDDALRRQVWQIFSALSEADDRGPTRVEEVKDTRVLAATEEEITTGVVDGANLLVMDMDLCVRCGNCSLACHKVHGQSRLLRRGIHIERPVRPQSKSTQHVLSPQVCMHCKDPECLTGCPTGAIFRDAGGHVDINPHTCIGCFDCATQCPYDAISMVPRASDNLETGKTFDLTGRLKNLLSLAPPAPPPPIGEADDMVAIKCNLCEDTPLNPAGARRKAYSCEENCPTGALVRVNPREYFSEVTETIGLVFRDETHAIGRNIHKRDPLALIWHAGGILATILFIIATAWGLVRYGQDEPLFGEGGWLTMRWLTGVVGLVGVAAVMTYPARKTIYRRRAGALRYWLLAHVYVGLVAGVLLLMHAGTRTGGLLTTLLYVAFDTVIASGLFGVACYIVVPRVMTSIEGEPLLIEDLTARREELRASLTGLADKAGERGGDELRQLILTKVKRRFSSFAYLLRQYARREPLKALLAGARKEFNEEAEKLHDRELHATLVEAVETAATLRRVESLVYLHKLLKLWLAPHVVSSALMLALTVVHVVQVVFFNVK